ncbi:MAG: hypothetical protein ACKVJG_18990, partial [Candidatus Latescibacterota bacterium]
MSSWDGHATQIKKEQSSAKKFNAQPTLFDEGEERTSIVQPPGDDFALFAQLVAKVADGGRVERATNLKQTEYRAQVKRVEVVDQQQRASRLEHTPRFAQETRNMIERAETEGNFVDEKKEGKQVSYHENGQVRREG